MEVINKARAKYTKNAELSDWMARKIARNGRSYVSRLGYNTGVTSYTQDVSIARLSGSSINRAVAKKRKDELQTLLAGPPKIYEKIGQTVDDYFNYKQEIGHIRDDLKAFQGAARKLSRPLQRSRAGFHVLSTRSKGKLRDKCTAFYRACGSKKTFATLTFIEAVTDDAAVSILNKFLTQLREDFPSLKYVWVAERQPAGNIHFHCIFNQFLKVRRYNDLWVRQQYTAGLRFEDYSLEHILSLSKSESIHKILNPFDVKSIKSVYGLSFYLTKYITKNNSEPFTCLAWHCSRSVSKLFTKTIVSRSCMKAVQGPINSRVDRKTGEMKECRRKHDYFYSLYYIENRPYFLKEMVELEQVNKWILQGWFPDDIPEEDERSIVKFYCN